MISNQTRKTQNGFQAYLFESENLTVYKLRTYDIVIFLCIVQNITLKKENEIDNERCNRNNKRQYYINIIYNINIKRKNLIILKDIPNYFLLKP